jgi:D-alanyl-D-alanine carboxypeptidase/D-alanyl-D-alanine-endopeptidase (penicillin-binding protein 4)
MGDLVQALAASGLREVTGRLIAYAGALPSRDMISADQPEQVGYNPAISGLMLNYNRVNFVWKKANKSWQVEMNAEGERFVPAVQMATMKVVAREVPLFTYQRGVAQDNWTVAASALGKNGSRWLPVRQAAVYVAEVFRTMCVAQGIKLPVAEVVYTLPLDAVPIVAHQSDALPDLLRKMLKFSTNLTAEAVGLTASGAATLEASGAAMTDWARARFGIGATFGDHSGLGPVSRVTPGDMARVMIAAQASPTGALLQGLMKDAGVADAKGKPQEKSAVRVQAKSGTMNFVSNLAGYVVADGQTLAFAVFAADLPRRDAVPLSQREQPEGDAAWVKRAHRLQQQLIRRWAGAYL